MPRGGGRRGGRHQPSRYQNGTHWQQLLLHPQQQQWGQSKIPGNVDTQLANSSLNWKNQGHHHELEALVPQQRRYVDEDEPMETPRTAVSEVFHRHALRSIKNKNPSESWQFLLEPITSKKPLPYVLTTALNEHFDTPDGHRPAQLKLQGLTIADYARFRDETSCFVCAALCDKIVTKRAEQAVLTPRTPAPRYISTISPAMADFLHNCENLAKLISQINIACYNKSADHLKNIFIRPDEAVGENLEFLGLLQQELKRTCPADNEGLLIQSVNSLTLAGWLSAAPVVLDYLRLIRDWVKPTTERKSAQLKKMTDDAIIALGDPTYGSLILPTVLDLSRFLALVVCKYGSTSAAIAQATGNSGDSQASTKHAKFLEDCANSLREAFIKCLVGGSSGSAAHSAAPDGKRIGIYITSNSCLRLLFQCRKLRNAQQMFVSIDAQSPFLDFYPRAQRITYLYYLGAYHFANSHFYRSQLALQAAYDLCHRQDYPHRRQILTYLMAANICLGRFPSQTLFSRPEATELTPHFYPLCKIVAQGDLGTFQKHLDLSSETSLWFLRKRILLQLRNRVEVLVWRTLIRKTFMFAGFQPEGQRMVPFLRLPFVQAAASFSLQRARAPSDRTLTKQGTFTFMKQQPTPPPEDTYIDPDLDGIDAAVNETGFDVESGSYDDAQVGQHQYSLLTTGNEETSPNMAEVESIFASLIQQGFLRGFLTHGEKPRFAVPGSGPNGGPLVHGFPNIWQVISAREDDTVPGWVRRDDQRKAGSSAMQSEFGAGAGGRVVNLSGARPAGAGA